MTTLKIPDIAYQEAAHAVAVVRRRSDPNVTDQAVEKILRAYVDLGVNKQIRDWSYQMPDPDKGQIADLVAARTRGMFNFSVAPGKVYVDLDILDYVSRQGSASPNVARPRAAQERYETELATGRDLTTVEANVQNVFGNIKKTAEAALKGLGISLPLEAVALIGGGLLVVLILRRRR